MKHILTPLLLALLTATTLTSFSSPAQVYAIPGPAGGVLDPSNVWAPYGPLTLKLQLKYYGDELGELTAFENGEIDLHDWSVPRFRWDRYDANPDFVLSRAQGEFSMFEVDFNHESSDWNAWGCDFDNGNSACGAEIRKAITHLIDRPQWVITGILGGAAQALADPTPPAKTPSGSTVATQQSWDTAHTTINAFNIAADPSGFAEPGSPDFCAARDHMIVAGIGFADTNNDCVIDNPPSTPIRFLIRSDSLPRRQAGLGIMAAMNQLFGADVFAEFFGDIILLGDIVFSAQPIDDWGMYTGGWSLGGPLANHLRPLYGSESASNLCGGRRNDRPLNYGFICVPEFDAHADAAIRTDSLSTYASETLAALDQFGKRALNIPLYSPGSRFLVLRDVQGAVDARGSGYPNFWTLLNARASSYVPVNPIYTFGGSSGPDTLRYGQRQGTNRLSIFHATTYWDFQALDLIYERLVRTSPIEPEKVIAWMANKYIISADAAGDTHIVFDLRAGLHFHDGHALTAEDVRFSLISYRDHICYLFGACPDILKDVVVHGPLKVELILRGRSLFHIFIADAPIIPKHLWDADNDGTVDAQKLDSSFDPVAAGILVGSGPWVCRSVFPADFGRPGTGCGRNPDGSRAGQQLNPGSIMTLERFDFSTPSAPFFQYMRTYNPSWPSTESGQFQEWSWADYDNNAEVDVVDVASVAACFGKTAPDSACPTTTFTYWDRLGTPNSITEEAVRVAARMDETWVCPNYFPCDYLNMVPFTP